MRHAHPLSLRPFPRQIWNQLSAADIRLLDELAYLSKLQAKRSPTGARYSYPGREWLAERLECSVRTVSRITAKLAALGMIDKLQRRPVDGHWQTNLYRLIHPLAWAVASIRATVLSLSNRLSLPARIASPLGTMNSVGPIGRSQDPVDYFAWAERIAAKARS